MMVKLSINRYINHVGNFSHIIHGVVTFVRATCRLCKQNLL